MAPRKSGKTPIQLFVDNVETLVNHFISDGRSTKRTFEYANSNIPGFNLPEDQFNIHLKTALVAWRASEKAHLQEIKSLKDENRGLSLELESAKKFTDQLIESNQKIASEKKNTVVEFKRMKKLVDSISASLSVLAHSDEIPDDHKKFIQECQNRLKSTGVVVLKNTDEKQHLAGWSLQFARDGIYRVFRTVKGKNVGIHIGRTIVVRKAVQKIRDKEAELGIEPLQIDKSDLAYRFLTKG